MNSDNELPADVVADITANRKISAIKRLRAHQGIGLKEAKEIVDAYISAHPSDSHNPIQKGDGGIGRILVLIIGVCLIYGLYKYFT